MLKANRIKSVCNSNAKNTNQDKITNHFEKYDKGNSTIMDKSNGIESDNNNTDNAQVINKTEKHIEGIVFQTPRSHSLPRIIGKRPLSSPDDVERGPLKSQKSEDMYSLLVTLQNSVSKIEEGQQNVLTKLNKLDEIEGSLSSLTEKVINVEKD